MEPQLINIDLSKINQSLELIDSKMSGIIIAKIKEASIYLPDFNSCDLDIIQIPILEKPKVLVSNSVYPLETDKFKIISFRKNYKTKSWEFNSKNF